MTQCGACTVLVNGAARRSCVTPVGSIGDNEVITLEGLGTLDKPHPLQKAFIDEQAAQCGYCASGMIMSAADLLNRNPQPKGSGRARGAGRQSLPLRHAQPDHPRRAARRATDRGPLIMNAPHLTRREFIATVGGIVLSFSLVPRVMLGQEPARLPGSLQTNRTLDAWLRINADGSVIVFTGKVELGQGIVTALAQIAAEETRCAAPRASR